MVMRLAAVILLSLFSSPLATGPVLPFASPQKSLQVLIEGEDPVMLELFGTELQSLAASGGTSLKLIKTGEKPYDLRIFFTSGAGSKTDYCTGSCSTTGSCTHQTVSCSCSSCSVTVTLYFNSAVMLKPDGTLQAADSGVGLSRAEARNLLVRKLVSRL